MISYCMAYNRLHDTYPQWHASWLHPLWIELLVSCLSAYVFPLYSTTEDCNMSWVDGYFQVDSTQFPG